MVKLYSMSCLAYRGNNGRLSAILKSIELKNSNVNLPQRPHILFHSNGLDIQHGLPNIGYEKVINGR